VNYSKENVCNESLKERRILLIEHDPDCADLIIDVLEEDNGKGIKTEVILKKDGEKAINYFQYEMQSQVSLVILDLNLPKIHGMEVLKFIKKNPKCHSIPVFIFSISSDDKTIEEAYKNGANAYIIKPGSYEDFVEKIRILKEYY